VIWVYWTERADAIAQAAQEVTEGRWDDQFVVDPFQAGAGTSHNMNMNEVIANRATQILGGKSGEYRSTPTITSIWPNLPMTPSLPLSVWEYLWRLNELLGTVEGLAAALREKASNLMISLNPGVHTCKTLYPSDWDRNSALMLGQSHVILSVSAARRKDSAA
jgi:aspartate ammonia-lyase